MSNGAKELAALKGRKNASGAGNCCDPPGIDVAATLGDLRGEALTLEKAVKGRKK